MSLSPASISVICVTGPTGSGKSALALRLAQAFGGMVLNADSRQVYRDFPIITAQPGVAEMELCPHGLYGFLPCGEKLSAGAFAKLAGEEIEKARAGNLLPVLCGGTGLYLKTLLRGIAPIPAVDPAIQTSWQERLREQGPAKLHRLLAGLDAESAARLHPNDSQRIIRALEVLESTGKTLGYWHKLPLSPSPYRSLSLYLDCALPELGPRLAERIDEMIRAGALKEAEAAYELCRDRKAPGWSGIGCAELFSYLAGECGLEECRALWLQRTRSYAKRQITWFRKETAEVSLNPGDTDTAIKLCKTFLL